MASQTKKKGGKGKKNGAPTDKVQLNACYTNEELKKQVHNDFINNCADSSVKLENTSGTLHKEPFTCCEMPRFIENEQFLDGLRNELSEMELIEKNNDLYKFHQSDDLKTITTPHIVALRKFFQEDVLAWLKQVTGISLTEKIDMTCSKYEHTDILLCHDDELEGRRIAFILYLVPPWKSDDGGALDLFDMDENGQPKNVVKSLLPEWNKFSWFEVTAASHHQVAEVLAQDKTRLSVNGWFHGPGVPRPPPYMEPALPLLPYGDVDEDKIYEWINPIYVDPGVQGEIQDKFEAESEIELQDFFKEEKYLELVNQMKSSDVKWGVRGPYNKRHYGKMEHASMPPLVKECLDIMQSEAFFLILSNMTGLRLHELAPEDTDSETSENEEESGSASAAKKSSKSKEKEDDDEPKSKKKKHDNDSQANDGSGDSNGTSGSNIEPKCRAEVRKWSHGCYTLVHDTDTEASEYALDAMYYCACKDWQQDSGGYTTYIAKGEDEELLTVVPAENSLALVYRDKDTLRFVKHINNQCNEMKSDKIFYDFSLTYVEK